MDDSTSEKMYLDEKALIVFDVVITKIKRKKGLLHDENSVVDHF